MLSDAPVASCNLVDYARPTPRPLSNQAQKHTHERVRAHTHLSMLKKTNRGERGGVEHEERIAYCTLHQILNCLLW